jgi:hypothetical protein
VFNESALHQGAVSNDCGCMTAAKFCPALGHFRTSGFSALPRPGERSRLSKFPFGMSIHVLQGESLG